MTTMDTEILTAIAKTSICSFDEIEKAYLKLESFDKVVASIYMSNKFNCSLGYIVDMVAKKGK